MVKEKGSIAKAYAQDLLPLAINEGILDRIKDELNYIRELLTSTPKLTEFINNPNIAKEVKKGIISELFSNNISPITMNHLSLMIDEGRQGMLLDIIEEFFKQAMIAENRVVAYATTSIPIPNKTANLLSGELSKLTGKEIDLVIAVDKSILGGIIIRIGDKVIDGSLSGRMQRMGKYLKARSLQQWRESSPSIN